MIWSTMYGVGTNRCIWGTSRENNYNQTNNHLVGYIYTTMLKEALMFVRREHKLWDYIKRERLYTIEFYYNDLY